MLRFIFACVFYTTIARWGYAEISLMFPSAIPYINKSLHSIQIPTHNNWSRDSAHGYMEQASDAFETAAVAIEDIQAFVEDRKVNSLYES